MQEAKCLEKLYLNAQDVAELLDISIGHSYKILREMNESLRNAGFIVIAGRVPTKLFKEKYYGLD